MNYKTIIDESINQFLNCIKSWADHGHHNEFIKKSGGFPLFLENIKTYYKQSFFDERIENAIWKYLINGIWKTLFSEDYCSARGISIIWPYMHPQLTTSYVEDIERHYPIEFIIEQNGERIAYRYTNWYCLGEERDEFFSSKEIDEIFIIDFSSTEISALLHPAVVSDKVYLISVKAFLEKYFSESFYLNYLKCIKEAVAEAYRYTGYQTISNLSSQNLPFFISEMMKKIENIDFSNQQYQIMGELKGWKKNDFEAPENVITVSDFEKINQRFINNERFLAMCGSSDFAHSFITSEYLYETMRDNNQFDFTAIVCGYLKSIEQLLYKLVLYTLDHHVDELWIKSNGFDKKNKHNFKDIKREGRRKTNHVKFEKELEKYFDTTFASLVNLLDDYDRGWDVSTGAKNAITVRLAIYCDECRNEHFHKDNINTYDEVKIIRNNTLLLFYYLLGGYILADDIEQDKLELQIINRSFEKIYDRIMCYGGGNYFSFELSSGEEVLVAMPINQENPQYDANGSLINTSIRFVKIERSAIDDWNSDDWKQIEREKSIGKTVYITPENIPNKIFYIDKLSNQKTEIEINLI